MLLRAITALTLAGAACAVKPADVSGLGFIDTATKQRLQIVGVDYQPGGQAGFDPDSGKDVLSDASICLRDATILQKLGVNTIRVYNVNPQTNHDQCMSIFNAAGIYVIIDVNSPFQSINRADPGSSYNLAYLNYIFANVENFKGYPNTLAFFGGNEIINDLPTAKDNPPYIRAVQRDLRRYIAKQSTRHIPVGYSAADVREVLQDTWSYLNCAINGSSTDDSRGEFFGLNSYSWCGKDATYSTAGYDVLVSTFKSTSIPVIFSEFGCNKPAGLARPFNEVGALYGPQMTTLNGGLVYEYSQEESDYGLVTINSDGSIKLKVDYDNLQGQYNKLDVSVLTNTAPSAGSIPKCDASLLTNSAFSTSFAIPNQPAGAQDLINNGVKNPTRGKLVDVNDLNVKQTVQSSSGKAITGLALKKTDGSNLPNGQSLSGSSTTGGGSSPSSTKKAAGNALEVSRVTGTMVLLGMLGVVMVAWL